MKAVVDKSGCISCGLCINLCSDVFRMGDDGTAEAYVDEVPEDAVEAASEARESCPVSVITID
jgi:ferredoxin